MDEQTRLKTLLAAVRDRFCGGNAAALARKIGKDATYVNRLFYPQDKKGAKGVGPEITSSCSAAFGLPRGFWEMAPSEALASLSRQDDVSLEKNHSDTTIMQFDTGGAMGHGVVLRDQPGVIKSWTVSDSWLQQNVHRITSAKNLCIVTGFGPSMQPLYNPGDPLLVDRGANRVDVDGVYFFRVGQDGFVKQLQRIPTSAGLVLRAKSYNALYDPFDITEGMDFEAFGRVVKVWKGEDF